MKEIKKELEKLAKLAVNYVEKSNNYSTKQEYYTNLDLLLNDIELSGTEKQIAWAKSIKREKMLQKLFDLNRTIDTLDDITDKTKRKYEVFTEKKEEQMKEIIDYVNISSAKEIIENR